MDGGRRAWLAQLGEPGTLDLRGHEFKTYVGYREDLNKNFLKKYMDFIKIMHIISMNVTLTL